MAILVGQGTRVLCQGITGLAGTHHTHRMMQYGTRVVAGVSPGKGGKNHLDVPVFNNVAEAMKETRANASALFVPPDQAGAAMIEAIASDLVKIGAIFWRRSKASVFADEVLAKPLQNMGFRLFHRSLTAAPVRSSRLAYPAKLVKPVAQSRLLSVFS